MTGVSANKLPFSVLKKLLGVEPKSPRYAGFNTIRSETRPYGPGDIQRQSPGKEKAIRKYGHSLRRELLSMQTEPYRFPPG